MSFLCHIVKCVDVSLSTSLFMNAEQRYQCAAIRACLVNSLSLHLLIKLPTHISLAVPSHNRIVTGASAVPCVVREEGCEE